ncbi:pilus assembly protein TadG-related protein [Chelativorans salis]|uniref:Pilus assembly protein TadG-related protein n=1 Tax=Chelativorans salis TaxID=2978478 RepID=A0ABT2LIK3_9HYPH|nr:pilus assembly protein TadG-related protein [Chelativorans sp. EGI FJ00035]MCT7374355.1 pilus assembly protein TadG-related protein [Chelativorans sp. EGI FJ00035]
MIGHSWIGRGSFSRTLRTVTKDERGAVAVIAAVVFPVVVGAIGLGAESGYWYLEQRKLQHAADVAVYAAAVRYRASDDQTAVEAAALRTASGTGYEPDIGTISVGPLSGSTPANGKISVDLTETHARLFSSIFSGKPMLLAARAVAEIKGGSKACVLALSKSASGAVTVTGSTDVELSGCSVVSNSSASDAFLMKNGSALMSTECVYTVGGAVTTTGLTLTGCSGAVEYAPPTPDPLAGIAEPGRMEIDQLPCRDLSYISDTTYTFDHLPSGQEAIRFCGGLDIKGTIDLKPGLYIIDGGEFTVSAGAFLTGTGVTFLLTGSATAKLTGNGDIDLSAPTTGPYAGVLLFGSRDSTGLNHQVTGNSESRLEGALYTPTGTIDFTGNSTVAGGCTQIIADRVNFTGNSTMQTCASTTNEIVVGQSIAIVE